MSSQGNEFIEWLNELENAKGYSDYEVAKQGGFSHSVLSRARAGIPPGWEVCAKIADVFGVSPVTAFRKAGLLPPGTDGEISFEDWKHLISQLEPEDEEEVREIAERKILRRKKEVRESSLKSLKPKRAEK
jgi:transcriptional regulator with XRE-family HTH domain